MRLALLGALLVVAMLALLLARGTTSERVTAMRRKPEADTPAPVAVPQVAGRVSAPGARIAAGVLVLAVLDEGAEEEKRLSWGAWTVTDETGTYAFPDTLGPPRGYTILALAPDGSAASATSLDTPTELSLTPPTRVHGTVLRAEDGAPLEGANVAADLAASTRVSATVASLLRSAAADPRAAACILATTARSGPDGSFELLLPLNLTRHVAATAPGRDTDAARVREGSDVLGPLVLGAGGAVAGVVREPDGTPVADALVELYPSGTFMSAYDPPDGYRCTSSDGDGRFLVEGLPDGVRFRAEAHHPRRDAHAARDAVPGGEPVDLVLAPLPRIEAHLDLGGWSGPDDGLSVHLAGECLWPVGSIPLTRVAPATFSSPPLNLPPGEYELRLGRGDPPLARCTFDLPPTGVVRVDDLRVPDGACVWRLHTGPFALRDSSCKVDHGTGFLHAATDDQGFAGVVLPDGAREPMLFVTGVDAPQPLRIRELLDLDLASDLSSRARVRLPPLDAERVFVEVVGHGNHEMSRLAVPPDRTLEFKSRDRTGIWVAIAADGRAPWIRRIDFAESRDLVLDAEMPPLRHGRVRLVGEDLKPLPGIEIELKQEAGIVSGQATATTDAEGRAVLPVLAGSTVRLRDDLWALMRFAKGADLDTEGETTLPAARAGAIRGQHYSDLLLDIVEPRLPVTRLIEIDYAGRFREEGLPPGLYRIRTFLERSEWFVDVAAGRTTVVALD